MDTDKGKPGGNRGTQSHGPTAFPARVARLPIILLKSDDAPESYRAGDAFSGISFFWLYLKD